MRQMGENFIPFGAFLLSFCSSELQIFIFAANSNNMQLKDSDRRKRFLSERISVVEASDSTSLIISPDYDQAKQKWLWLWVTLWSLAGIAVLLQLFGDYSKEEKLYLSVWLAFWFYFEYVGIYALLWKIKGFERLLINKDSFIYSKNLGKSGKKQIFPKQNISSLIPIAVSEKSLIFNLTNSYWNRGNEAVEIRVNGQNIRFGLKLSKPEAASVISFLRKSGIPPQ
jgi:hypothetical protein